MNKKAKILSLCLAAVLLCACVVGFMMVGANAANDGYTHTWTVTGTADGKDANVLEDSRTFKTLQAALEAAKACEGQWADNANLQILIATNTGQLPTRTADGILFVETIWRGDRETDSFGNKLPITIEGADGYTAMIGSGSSYASGSFQVYKGDGTFGSSTACIFTNDYTFKNLTLAMGESVNYFSYFYAGSGNVTFDNVDASGLKRAHFYGDNRTQAAYLGWTKADVDAIRKNNDGLIPSSFTFKNGTVIYTTDKSESTSSLKKIAGARLYGTNAQVTEFADIVATDAELNDGVAELVIPANCSVGIIIPNSVTINYPDYYVQYCPDNVADDKTTTDEDETEVYYPASYGNVRVDVRNSSKFYLFRTRPASRAGETERDINSNTTIHLYQDLSTLQHSTSYDLTVLLNRAIPTGKTFDIHLHNGVTYGIRFASSYGFSTNANSTLNITVHPFEDSTNTAAEYPDGLDLIEYGANASYANGAINVTIKDGVTINGSLKLYSKTGMRDFDSDGVHTNPVQATHTTTIEEGATVETFMGPRGRVIINNIQGTVTNFFGNTPTTRSSTTSSLDLSEADSVTNNIAATAKIENFYGTGYFTRVTYHTVTTVTPTEDEPTIGKDTYRFYYFGQEIPAVGSEAITSTTEDAEAGTTTVKKECYTAHSLYNCNAETVVNNIAAGASVGTFKATSSTTTAQNVNNNIATAQTFTAIDATVPGTFVLGENASITVANIEGKINLSADAWKTGKTYLTYNDAEGALADHVGTTFDGNGRVLEVSGNTLVAATTVRASGNLALTDRIAVRFYFDEAKVAAVGAQNVTLAVSLNKQPLEVGKIQHDEKGYFFEVHGITAKDLNVDIDYSGSILESGTTSLNDILVATKDGASQQLEDLCDAIAALGGADVTVPATKVPTDSVNVDKAEVPAGFNATGYGIVMNDAVGFTVYGAAVTDGHYVVKVGDDEVAYTAGNGYIDIFVNVASAQKVMDITIEAEDGTVDFSMTASVEQIASQYEDNNADAMGILAYIQAANVYAATQA